MWRKLWRVMLIGTALVLALTAAAGAKPPGDRCPGHPSCTTNTTVPDSSTTTTEAPTEPWTCVARARNGASAWVIGEWMTDAGDVIEYFDRVDLAWAYPNGIGDDSLPVPDHYRTYVDERSGVPACFDIHPAHFDVTDWKVSWNPAPGSFTNEKGKLGGLKMQFEREVHGEVYWEYVARSVEARYCTTDDPVRCDPRLSEDEEVPEAWRAPDEGIDSLVFVAMPSHRDNWVFDASNRLTVTPDQP